MGVGMTTMTTWRKELEKCLKHTGDNWDELTINIKKGGLDKEFDPGYGSAEGDPFTAWSDRYVYFPAECDGSEWATYVHRNPTEGKAGRTQHIG
jgi:hypothetical protein